MVPGVLDWRRELAPLSTLTRQLIWVHGAFIVLTIFGLGMISLFNAETLASGTLLARSICTFIAIFWGARLSLQFLLFDPRPHLKHPLLRAGHHALTVAFTYLTLVFAWGASAPHTTLFAFTGG
jgi:hypothetical protein